VEEDITFHKAKTKEFVNARNMAQKQLNDVQVANATKLEDFKRGVGDLHKLDKKICGYTPTKVGEASSKLDKIASLVETKKEALETTQQELHKIRLAAQENNHQKKNLSATQNWKKRLNLSTERRLLSRNTTI